MIKLLGERINNEESVYYWASKVIFKKDAFIHRMTFQFSVPRLLMDQLVICFSSIVT